MKRKMISESSNTISYYTISLHYLNNNHISMCKRNTYVNILSKRYLRNKNFIYSS